MVEILQKKDAMNKSMVTANGSGYSNDTNSFSVRDGRYEPVTRDNYSYASRNATDNGTTGYSLRDGNVDGNRPDETLARSESVEKAANSYDSSSRARKNRQERFEESLGKLNPPRWMSGGKTTETPSTNWRSTSAESRQSNGDKPTASTTTSQSSTAITSTTSAPTASSSSATTTRYSYADYRRSYSAQRHATSSTSYWKSSEYNNSLSRPLSREPSPVPTWSRPPTAQAGGRFSRWSASTLSDSAYSGQNTPTDSVVSSRSILDGGGGIGAYTRQQKPYLGWRSQENVSTTDPKCGRNTPNERLATSLRRSQQSGLDRTSPFGSLSSSLAGGYHGSSVWRGSGRSSFSRDNTPGPAEWFVHDSIKSVSCAIAEFCKADDVPALPTSAEDKIRRRRNRTTRSRTSDSDNQYQQAPKSRLVWLESSFVSSTTNVNKNNSTQL